MTEPTEEEFSPERVFANLLESTAKSLDAFRLALERLEVADRQRRKFVWVILGFTAVNSLLLIGMVIGAFFLGRVVADTNNAAEDARSTNQTLLECTTEANPDAEDEEDRLHECYERGQASQQSAIVAISVNTILAAECAVEGLETGVTVRDCVTARFPAALQEALEQMEATDGNDNP